MRANQRVRPTRRIVEVKSIRRLCRPAACDRRHKPERPSTSSPWGAVDLSDRDLSPFVTGMFHLHVRTSRLTMRDLLASINKVTILRQLYDVPGLSLRC